MPDFHIGFVIFAGITQLDFTGPFEVLSRLGTPPSIDAPSPFPQSKTHVVAKTMLPVASDRGLGFLPTCTFGTCPALNLICVPGGGGIVDALADEETIDFIRRQGARRVRHFGMHRRLPPRRGGFAAGPAGRDFAFSIVAELAGPEVAQAIQLGIEYDPSPPFDKGHPDKASATAMALMSQRNQAARTGIQKALGGLNARAR